MLEKWKRALNEEEKHEMLVVHVFICLRDCSVK